MKQTIYTIILLLLLPQIADAQSKPKRDTSKDRSVIVAKQKKEKKQKRPALIAEQKKRPARRNAHKKTIAPVIQSATYLRVNQLTSLSKIFDSKAGGLWFDVATDGKDWSIDNLPYWCHVSKYPTSFVFTYDANPTHEDRQSWFDVRSDDQQVRVNVTQQGAPINIQAKFNYAYLKHNQFIKSVGNCLEINSHVTISGAAGQKFLVVALIADEEGNYVKANYQSYTLPNSDILCVSSKVTPSTVNEETFNVISYLPNKAMNLVKKNNNLRCKLLVYCEKTNEYVNGATYTMPFRAKSKHGVVTTEYH